MKFPKWLKVYGDQKYRGPYPSEDVEHVNFVSWVRFNHPEIGALLMHPKNAGKRSPMQINKERKLGFKKGASDIVIPASPSFICEIKKLDHTKCKWETGQQDYLLAGHNLGSFACVALGAEGAKLAFNDWLKLLTALK